MSEHSGYKRLQVLQRWQEVIKGLQGVKRGYKRLEGVTRGYKG